MQGNIDAVVVGVGSGGTLTGVGRFLAKHSPKSRMILADPVGSVLAPFVESGRMPTAGSWAVEGIGEDFVPPNADLKLVQKAYAISDPDSFAAARDLLRLEGVLAGSSSGTLLAAALRYCREQSEPQSAGIETTYVDLSNPETLSAAIRPSTRLVWLETPTNPMLKVIDLERIAALARAKKIMTVCDNTFASPWIQRPLEYGFDLVMHSTTKYLNGHSDMVGGIVIVGDNSELCDRLAFLQNAVGAIQGPFDSFLALRGVKTLALRMERQSASALQIAQWLAQHPRIRRVHYPGLTTHPQHELACRQMRAFGAMIAVEIDGTSDDARRFLERCRLFTLAESLGGVESLISLPALMTHASTAEEVRASLGIIDTLIRISVGIEDVEDLTRDLKVALN
jgi:cystathionine beta-lyase/cystathionine gamma-synthase